MLVLDMLLISHVWYGCVLDLTAFFHCCVIGFTSVILVGGNGGARDTVGRRQDRPSPGRCPPRKVAGGRAEPLRCLEDGRGGSCYPPVIKTVLITPH